MIYVTFFPATNYRVGKDMSVSFEFRTHKKEGLILTLSNGPSGPALTIELYDGRVCYLSITYNCILNQDYTKIICHS